MKSVDLNEQETIQLTIFAERSARYKAERELLQTREQLNQAGAQHQLLQIATRLNVPVEKLSVSFNGDGALHATVQEDEAPAEIQAEAPVE